MAQARLRRLLVAWGPELPLVCEIKVDHTHRTRRVPCKGGATRLPTGYTFARRAMARSLQASRAHLKLQGVALSQRFKEGELQRVRYVDADP